MGQDLVEGFAADDFRVSVREVLERAVAGDETANYEFPLLSKQGVRVDILLNATTRRDIDGKVIGVIGVIGVGQNVTEAKAAQAAIREKDLRLQQSQKMQAVGQLAGGLAHDFNNLLTVIGGNLRFLQADLGEVSEDIGELLTDSISASDDGSALTERLLGFSRTEEVAPVVEDSGGVIAELARLASRTLGANILLRTELSDDPLVCRLDQAQCENALLNLILNGRDAMPDGGEIVIRSSLYVHDSAQVSDLDLAAGRYLRVTVIDEGQGIPAHHMDRIFEPFFSTKDSGGGTGLGLSMVYGFAEQSGGVCVVDETSSHGTSISLYLPLHEEVDVPRDPAGAGEGQLTTAVAAREYKSRVILVAEDKARVRKVAVRMLQKLGHVTLEAENAEEAREQMQLNQDIEMLFSDVLMPGDMDGYHLADWTAEHHPKILVVLVSGYTSRRRGGQSTGEAIPLLKKPFSSRQLADFVNKPFDNI